MAVDAYIGEISLFAGPFAPKGWRDCDGASLSINEYSALFSLLGNTYGGSQKEGIFMLPDLRGRAPVGIGDGKSLSPVTQGEQNGAETFHITTTLSKEQIPPHPHDFNLASGPADGSSPGSTTALATGFLDSDQMPVQFCRKLDDRKTVVTLDPATISSKTTPPTAPLKIDVNTRSPFLGMRYIICVVGSFPTRE